MNPAASPGPDAPLERWLDYISAQHPAQIALGLERVRDVMGRMALAPPPFSITVGGTNGKGSTCAYLECILRTAGYRAGLNGQDFEASQRALARCVPNRPGLRRPGIVVRSGSAA